MNKFVVIFYGIFNISSNFAISGAGSVECRSVSDAFQLIQLGMSNHAPRCAHSLFTITLEQQWLLDNTVQHRVSTASFADVAGCEKVLVMDNNGATQSIPTDSNMLTLQRCVLALSEPFGSVQSVPYNQSVLTTLLRDSFGGRAKTLLLACVSPLLRDYNETYYTLQFAMRAQAVRNLVTLNSYITYEAGNDMSDVFGLQFAASQLFKLVRNAEDLFQKLMSAGVVGKADSERISDWLTLKQECEECLSEASEPHRSLERIDEEIEDSSAESSEDSEPDCRTDLAAYVQAFKAKTDQLVACEFQVEFLNTIFLNFGAQMY